MELEFNISLLIIYVLVTVIPFIWIFKEDIKGKVFFSLILLFLFLYTGIGGALKDVNTDYLYFYSSYFIVFGVTIRVSKVGFDFNNRDDQIFVGYIDKRGSAIIALYTLLGLLSLLFPEVIIGRLISPPSPDVYAALDMRFSDNDPGIIANIIELFQTFLLPFYYWALYTYRESIVKMAGILFFNLYITYCHDSYMGRYVVLLTAFVLFLAYLSRIPKRRQIMVILVSIMSIPLMSFLLFQYTFLRHGDAMVNISFSEAMGILFGQEITYPILYDSYKDFYDPSLIWSYFEWILFLPFPSFFKFGLGQFPSYKFTEVVTGLSPGDPGFNILLPGVIGESVFYFGHQLFFVHAIILGFIIKVIYISFKKSKSLTYVLFFYALVFSFQLSRGGTLSVYPHFFKHFVALTIFLLILKHNSKKHVVVR